MVINDIKHEPMNDKVKVDDFKCNVYSKCYNKSKYGINLTNTTQSFLFQMHIYVFLECFIPIHMKTKVKSCIFVS